HGFLQRRSRAKPSSIGQDNRIRPSQPKDKRDDRMPSRTDIKNGDACSRSSQILEVLYHLEATMYRGLVIPQRRRTTGSFLLPALEKVVSGDIASRPLDRRSCCSHLPTHTTSSVYERTSIVRLRTSAKKRIWSIPRNNPNRVARYGRISLKLSRW